MKQALTLIGIIFFIQAAMAQADEVINPSAGIYWRLRGNVNTNDPVTPPVYGTSTIGATEHFLGTTDANDVAFGTDRLERMRIKQTTGYVGIGTATPTTRLDVLSRNGWDVVNTSGDMTISGTYPFRIGVAQGGAGAGDVYMLSRLGTQRIFMGGGTNNQILTVSGVANAVGVRTTGVLVPASAIDVVGDLALREGTAIAVLAGNNAIALTGEYSHYRLTGASAFAVNTITNGNDGQVLTLINATGQIMTINNNNAANGILTGTGANLVSTAAANNSVTLIYNATLARWVVTSSTNMVGGNDWHLTGNTGTNDPAIPVTYGTSTIAATENWMGTTDANDIVFGTNNLERMRLKQTNGYVGIGTAAPAATTEIYANSAVLVPQLLLRENGNDYARLSFMNTNTAAKHWTTSAYLDAATDANSVFNVYYSTATNIFSVTGNNRAGVMVNQIPNTTFDVNGDFAMREGTAIALANGVNSNIAVGATSHIRITGPTAAFSITGIAGGVNGKVVTLINTTAQQMTLTNDATSVAANRIYNPAGLPLVLNGQYNTVTLIYNSTLARWVIKGTGNDSYANDWHLTGNTGINDPAAPVTYGTSAIAATENWMGTTDANDIVFGTNNLERMRIKQTTGSVGIGLATSGDALAVTNIAAAANKRIRVGSHTNFNETEAGRITFDESVSTYTGTANYCGLEFRHDGALNKLFLEAGCTGTINLMTYERGGNIGINTADPTQALEIGGTAAQIYMNSLASNMLYYNTEGVAAPTFTTRSVGTKIVFYPQVSATSVDYAMGITGATLWRSVPEAAAAYNHRWYAGTTELMRLRGDGRLGVGTGAPVATRLHCFDPSLGTARVAIFANGAADGTEVQIGSIEYMHDYANTTDFNNGFNSIGFTINYAAPSGYDLQLAYDFAAKPTTNTWTIASDARLKEDVNPFKDGLKTLKQINPVYFKYTGKAGLPQDYGIGVLAQEIQKVAPYTVGTWEYLPGETPIDDNAKSKIEEYLSLNNGALTYVTINAVKELDNKVEALRTTQTTISDFGTANMSSDQLHIDYSNEFSSQLTGMPVVTITAINSGASLYITEQTEKGFTVKYNGAGKPASFNWMAMAKVNSHITEPQTVYTEEERNRMISKVKLHPAKIELQAELDEMAKRKAEAKQQEEREKAEAAEVAKTVVPKPVEFYPIPDDMKEQLPK